MECTDCGLIFQGEVGTAALRERLYEQWIDPDLAWARHRKRAGLRRSLNQARTIASIIAQLQRPSADIAMLDFGMGWGDWCAMARGFGCRVTGVELSARRGAHAAALGIDVIAGDALGEGRFDFVNVFHVLEHVPDPFEVVSRIARSLARHGLVRIAVPDVDHIRDRLAQLTAASTPEFVESLNAVAPLEHINAFDARSLTRMAARAGLQPATFAYLPPFDDRLAVAGSGTAFHQWIGRVLRPFRSRRRDSPRAATDIYFAPARPLPPAP